VCPEKEIKMFLIISSIKLGRFWWNLLHSFLNKFATKLCKRFPPYLNNVSKLTTSGKYCMRRCSKHSSVINWNRLENGVGPAGSCRHCGSHSSVASSIAPDQWRMFCTPSRLAIFLHAVINWIQICRIWRQQLRWDKCWGYFL